MPRGRGGARQGTPGTAYPNRSDLQAAEPVEVAPAKEYGERQQQQAAQRALPIAPSPQPAASPPAPQAPPQPQQPNSASSLPDINGQVPWLHPTQRPNEPITAGLPIGAGPGPEALTGIGAIAANQQTEQGTLRNLLSSLAAGPSSSSAIRDLASVAGAG